MELETGQNGTLTQYPGKGFGQTWLGADGATVTLYRGQLSATRGMGDDIMGSTSSMPHWDKIGSASNYEKTLSYLNGSNQISAIKYECKLTLINKSETIKIWKVSHTIKKYHENCFRDDHEIKNTYYLDSRNIVRKSYQYHSETLGYLKIERVDR